MSEQTIYGSSIALTAFGSIALLDVVLELIWGPVPRLLRIAG